MHEIIWVRHSDVTRARFPPRLLGYRFAAYSRSGTLQICAYGVTPIAVDLELLRARHSSFWGFVGLPSEYTFVDRGPYEATILWTIKESCYKLGIGGYEPEDYRVVGRTGDAILVHGARKAYIVTVSREILPGFVLAIAREKQTIVR